MPVRPSQERILVEGQKKKSERICEWTKIRVNRERIPACRVKLTKSDLFADFDGSFHDNSIKKKRSNIIVF